MARLLLLMITTLLLASCASQPQQETVNYLSLGDSLAVGVGASDPQESGYTPLYAEMLQGQTGGAAQTSNLGVSGETSDSFIGDYPRKEDSQLARAVEKLDQHPDARVTLSIGGNDLRNASPSGRRTAISGLRENLDLILGELSESGTASRTTVLTLYDPTQANSDDRWISAANEAIRATASDHGVKVAPTDRAFEGHAQKYTHHDEYPWDIHPTDEGYAAIARSLNEADRP